HPESVLRELPAGRRVDRGAVAERLGCRRRPRLVCLLRVAGALRGRKVPPQPCRGRVRAVQGAHGTSGAEDLRARLTRASASAAPRSVAGYPRGGTGGGVVAVVAANTFIALA